VGNTSVGFTPLDELGTASYLGYEGGLYPGGLNDMPSAHHVAGAAKAGMIQLLDNAGNPSPAGKIVILTLGMSNANQVFSKLGELMSGLWAPGVVLVNGAQGGVDAALWSNPTHAAWSKAQDFLTASGVTAAQVQVVLNFHAVAHSNTPPQPWPGTPGDLQGFQEAIAGHIVSKFPNVRMSWWATREYGGYATTPNNPEPYAYQSAFAVKWMIERQIQGLALNHNPAHGPVTAPWMAWGPYLWADGLNPRGDGLAWEPRDFQSDGVHPNSRGRVKEAGPWARLIRTDPLFATWAVPSGNRTPLAAITFPQHNVAVTVDGALAIEAFAQDDDGAIARVDFYHGATLLGTDTSPPYAWLWDAPTPGDYLLHVVATDDQGMSRTSAVVNAKLLAPVTGTTLANDSFESGDFLGGGGWTMSSWSVSGPTTAVATSASDGVWSAQLDANASIARSLPLDDTAGAVLEFDWRSALPPGAAFTVEIHNGSWKPVFTRIAVNQSTWTRESVPLDAQGGASAFGIRFRTTVTGAFAGVDNIAVVKSSNPAVVTLPNPTLQMLAGERILLRWPAVKGRTYTIQSSPDLADWNALHHTTADESSDVIFMQPKSGATHFFRIQSPGSSE
jgi:Bacterial Ig domain